MAGYVPHFEPIWTLTWAEVTSKWVQVSWGQVVPSWSQARPKLWPIGPSWAEVGACWPKLAPSRANVAAMSDRNGPFGRCFVDLQSVQITAAGNWLLAPCPGKTCPPPASYLSDRSVRSHPLLNHASAPSVRADLDAVGPERITQRFVSGTCMSDPKSARAQAKLKETTCKMESKEQTNKNPTKIGLGEMLDSSLSAVTEQCQEPSCSSCWIPRCFHQCYATL